ncbi:polysaccharide pyruvyl transferase family protein [Oryzicola mucosus]|uniref:Polysaccharide pyruvyl transferase family protein n=1 Tax=Oryzicola mucosus TaxID=2767425 RepID=A0A8J6PVR6_9HYPH|nr:polysaccharide pyruvyl transferase family protein [Oryzicola mucosus]MBD0415202.1 polysaccharide pyruvyl transferase family protein [Oryzicola mucosus]
MTNPLSSRVAIAGVFDIANYGDQLFPLVAAYRLAKYGIEVVAISPVSQHTLRSDAVQPHDLTWLMTTDEAIDAVLIGGGNILYNLRVDYTAIWQLDRSKFGRGQHTGLWLGASIAASFRDIPFGFNAPGVPYPFSGPVAQDVLKPALEAADVVAVRDEASARIARVAQADVSVVPDTAIDISSMWPRRSLDPVLSAVQERLGLDGKPYAAIHLRANPGDDAHIADVARHLDAFCAGQQLQAVLVAIGDDMGDSLTARSLQAAMTSRAFVLDGSATLREVAAIIANAQAFVGGSLHGYITAAAYGVPGVIVTAHPQNKFSGFLKWMRRPQDFAGTWQKACQTVTEQLWEGSKPVVPGEIRAALDWHWDSVAEMVQNPDRRRKERAAFLRTMIGRASSRQGMGWLLSPSAAAAKSAGAT